MQNGVTSSAALGHMELSCFAQQTVINDHCALGSEIQKQRRQTLCPPSAHNLKEKTTDFR